MKLIVKGTPKYWNLLSQYLTEKCKFVLGEVVKAVIFRDEFLKFTNEKGQPLFFNLSNFYDLLENFFHQNLYPIEFKKHSSGKCIFGLTINDIESTVKAEKNAYSKEYRKTKAEEIGKKLHPGINRTKKLVKRNPLPKEVFNWDIHNIYPENFHEWLLDYQNIGNMEYSIVFDARTSLWRSYAFNWKEVNYWAYKFVLSWVDKHLEHLDIENRFITDWSSQIDKLKTYSDSKTVSPSTDIYSANMVCHEEVTDDKNDD